MKSVEEVLSHFSKKALNGLGDECYFIAENIRPFNALEDVYICDDILSGHSIIFTCDIKEYTIKPYIFKGQFTARGYYDSYIIKKDLAETLFPEYLL